MLEKIFAALMSDAGLAILTIVMATMTAVLSIFIIVAARRSSRRMKKLAAEMAAANAAWEERQLGRLSEFYGTSIQDPSPDGRKPSGLGGITAHFSGLPS